ncbi:4-carboxymuconolactone decarboxylase [Variovorax sp. GrIS 2.14]|uniref:carboxymuconolactone decarboxylase family protein n=1 Tax=Variovorax sp. GrIS 2.14 TaxID=3071709 RepID=UPI0038F71BBB
MARIQPVAPEAMSPELKALLETRPPYNIYRILANAPTALPGFVKLAGALLTQSELDRQLREMVILRVGAHCRSTYEIHQHLRLARHVGVSEERIRKSMDLDLALDGGITAEDRMLAFTDSVVLSVKAPASQFEALREYLSPRGITELLMTIGTYMMVSRLLENLEVELEQNGVDIASKAYYPPSIAG